jgi:hypothetical protein
LGFLQCFKATRPAPPPPGGPKGISPAWYILAIFNPRTAKFGLGDPDFFVLGWDFCYVWKQPNSILFCFGGFKFSPWYLVLTQTSADKLCSLQTDNPQFWKLCGMGGEGINANGVQIIPTVHVKPKTS